MQNYELFNGLPCGTNTQKIYEEFAEKFGWDKFQANQFGSKGYLYMPVAPRPRAITYGL